MKKNEFKFTPSYFKIISTSLVRVASIVYLTQLMVILGQNVREFRKINVC